MVYKSILLRFASVVNAYRSARGLTLEDVGKKVGLSKYSISRKLSGKSPVSLEEMCEIAKVLRFTKSDIEFVFNGRISK